MTPDINPVELKVFLNHIYELKKGVRQMVLYTTNKRYEDFAVKRLRSQRIKFVIQPVDDERINLFFGKAECIEAIRMMVTRPLNLLTPEEDFILGAMLGYDICAQCKRYCTRKARKRGCVKMHTLFFMTKPRLSQAEALLLPKDFVSLSISKVIWQRYIFVLTIPIKSSFSHKE